MSQRLPANFNKGELFIKIRNESLNHVTIKNSKNLNPTNYFGLEDLDTLLEKFGIMDIKKQNDTTFLIRFPKSSDIELIKSKLEENDHIEGVSYNYFRGISL